MEALERHDSRSDEQLFQAWVNGESRGFENLLARYQGSLYKVILGWTRNPHLSQDLFQQTWVRVIEHREKFDPSRKFSSWLFSIALNLTRDHFRKAGRERTDADSDRLEFMSAPGAGADQRLVDKERMERLRDALLGLSEVEREVFMMRHFGFLSFQEIADALGVNLNTALSRMHQACRRLKKLMKDQT